MHKQYPSKTIRFYSIFLPIISTTTGKMIPGLSRINVFIKVSRTRVYVYKQLFRDRRFNLKGRGLWFFWFVQNFFFLHQNQNIFFSNIGNQNIFLENNRVEVQNVGQSNLSILISLLVFPCYYIWVLTNCDMRFINLTRKIARCTCSSVRGSNEPSKPIRIKKIHSHLINWYIIPQNKTFIIFLANLMGLKTFWNFISKS